MVTYTIENNIIEIDFHGEKPNVSIRNKMKAVKIWWNPQKMVWYGPVNNSTIAVANEICGENEKPSVISSTNSSERRDIRILDYAFKVKIKDIVNANDNQVQVWNNKLKNYVNEVMSEDNATHSSNAVSTSQEEAWMDCFKFIAKHLSSLSQEKQEFELVFEYSLPGTVHERPDVFLLTAGKAISLEFKRKRAPQVDDNKDDIAQAIRYKEWLENHHKVTREKSLKVKSYLVCTHDKAAAGKLRGIEILTKDNFCSAINSELENESGCIFIEEWLSSAKTEMPDMLQAIEIMYREGRIPYISDVNENCLNKVLGYIEDARINRKKILILINGVPGAGKTAVGQSIVYEENRNREANAVYLSGNGPLVEVLQYQIDQVGNNKHIGENAIQGMKDFKSNFFDNLNVNNLNVPEQSILIFDEAQRAWDAEKLKRGFSEPEGLFRVCERIFEERGYAVLIGLYGNGQVIYTGEEVGISLWQEALQKHNDWFVIASEEIVSNLNDLGDRKIVDNDMFLPVSLRADFIDCSKWVEQAIGRTGVTFAEAQNELAKLQNTSMRICVTRDMDQVRCRMAEINEDHPEWKYGILMSNFAEQSVIQRALPDWVIKGSRSRPAPNMVQNGSYGPWFAGGCRRLEQACSVYGNQGLELDCPIVVFGGEYVRQNNRWVAMGSRYDYDVREQNYDDTDAIVENNFRVLLTRARKDMIILIPRDSRLDETYNYFVKMGMDVL